MYLNLLLILIICILNKCLSYTYDYCGAPIYDEEENVYKSLDTSKYTLKKLQLITRHGSRSPCNVFTYPFATYNCNITNEIILDNTAEYIENIIDSTSLSPNLWHGNCKIGQLNLNGSKQHISLGNSLRDIYVNQLNFLDYNLTEDNINNMYFRSTDVLRTKQSLQSLLLGLYPSNMRKNNIKISYDIVDPMIETINPNPKNCPALFALDNEMYQSNQWILSYNNTSMNNLIKKLQDIFQISGENWGLNGNINGFFDNFHTLQCTNQLHLLKDKFTKDEINQIYTHSSYFYQYKYLYYKPIERAKLAISGLLQIFINNLNQSNNNKFSYYSGHDDTIAALLGVFQLDQFKWPPYASHIIIEQWIDNNNQNNNNDKIIRVLYNTKILQICQQKDFCTQDEFITYLQQYIEKNLFQACNKINNHTHIKLSSKKFY